MIMYQSEAVTNELTAPYYGMDRDKMVGLAYWGAIEYWASQTVGPRKGGTTLSSTILSSHIHRPI